MCDGRKLPITFLLSCESLASNETNANGQLIRRNSQTYIQTDTDGVLENEFILSN